MADTYTYKARNPQGALLQGELQADNDALVLSRLREMGYVPLEVKAKKAGLKKEFVLRPGRVKLKDLTVFTRQFATMINSGLPLLRCLSILEQQTAAKELAKVVGKMRTEVEQGASLSESLEQHPKTFNRLFVAMVRAGETGGVLDSVLLRVADTMEAEVALRRKIKSAMTYPIVVFALVVIILTAMLIFVVPTFETLYKDLGGTLPAPTKLLIAASNIVTKYFLFVVAGIAVMIYGARRYILTDRGRRQFDRLKLKIPIFGGLFHKTALSRFSRTLGVLSSSGVPILQALDIVAETVGNSIMADAVRDIQESVKQGENITKPLSRHEIFPPMVVQMLAVGEETGALDTMLEKIAEFYDAEIEATVDSLTALIEPLMVAVVGGTVGAIVISLYLPLFKIFELIK